MELEAGSAGRAPRQAGRNGPDWFREQTMPVSAWLVDAVHPQPGQTILDLAAGIGDTGFLAAELIQPGGTLITADFSPDMLVRRPAAGRARSASTASASARSTRTCRSTSPPPASTACSAAGSTCWSTTPRTRCARPGACSRSAPPSRSPPGPGRRRTCGASRRARILRGRGLIDPPDPNGPGPVRLGRPRTLIRSTWRRPGSSSRAVERRRLRHALRGRRRVVGRRRPRQRRRSASPTSGWTSPPAATCWPSWRRRAEPFQQPDDTLVIPARTWVATATA